MARALKIFIVDDDVDFAESLAETLEAKGHEIELAHSGEAALQRFRETDFDIAFMDVVMPGMNGVESLMEIRKIKPSVQIMMMTGYSMEELLDQAIENGALGILDKPLDMNKVLQTLEEVKPEGIVLIADDNPDFSESVANMLTNAGYKVLLADNGEKAVEQALASDIDALVLDLRMPLLSGLEVYLRLKEQDRVVPTIIVTGYPEEESDTLASLRAAKVSGYLQKPFNPEELLNSINVVMGKE